MISRLSLLAPASTPAQRRFRFPDDEGIEPLATGVAARARAGLGRWDVAWRGPERRAAETALALGVEATPQPELRSWSMGDWAGRSVDDVATHDPAGFAAWRADPDGAAAGGESLRALLARVGTWVDLHTRSQARAVVVADPAVIRAAVVHVLEADHAAFWTLDVEPLSLTVIQRSAGQLRLRSVGVPPR